MPLTCALAVPMFALTRVGGVAYGIYRGNLLFLGEYQMYFIECVENISNFTSA